MADKVTPEVRSRMMAAVKSKDTSVETSVRKALHAVGFRYRIHKRIGKSRPDILLPKHSAAIFVHGCFWHGHVNCRYSRMPKSNVEFWALKIERNIARDIRNEEEMAALGWRVAIIWECAIRYPCTTPIRDLITGWLKDGGERLEVRGETETSAAKRKTAS